VLLPLKLLALLWFSLHGIAATESDRTETTCEQATAAENLLVLVNKSASHRLAKQWRPSDLVRLPRGVMKRGNSGQLRREAATALRNMLAVAKGDRQQIRVLSAYRSFRKQKRIFRSKERRHGIHHASRVSAMAGHSQHQLGTTVDLAASRFNWRLTQRLAGAPEGKWLRDNAHLYGFALSYPKGKEEITGYIHEPWHYRYIGRAAASEMKELGISMETYLQRCRSCDAQLACRGSKLD
jgi:D-alanyl-D-alanine carboxypeptidase